MTCDNCEVAVPGSIVRVDKEGCCVSCGKYFSYKTVDNTAEWDFYFYNICKAVADKSPCLSRKIGAIIVRDKSIVATGYNGPPRGVPHCGQKRFELDSQFEHIPAKEAEDFYTQCPRRAMGYASGKGLELCTACHAEVNAVINAARLGVSTLDSTMYMNCVVSCRECMKVLINAGIKELVIESLEHYDDSTNFLLENSGIKVRIFRRLEN